MYSYKVILYYTLLNKKKLFMINSLSNKKSVSLLLKQKDFYFLSLHFKLSSFFYSTQLLDNFAMSNYSSGANSSVIVSNFCSLKNDFKFYVFYSNLSKDFKTSSEANKTISELFNNANWLEREMLELSGIFFYNKKDVRNLMLPYGDSSSPFVKSFPSIGFREIYYLFINDSIISSKISVQF